MDTQLHAPRTPTPQHAHPKLRRHPREKRKNLNNSHNQRQKVPRRHSRRTSPRRPLQRGRHGLPQPIPIHNQGLEPRLPIDTVPAPRMQKQHRPKHTPLGLQTQTRHGKPPYRLAYETCRVSWYKSRAKDKSLPAGTAKLVQRRPRSTESHPERQLRRVRSRKLRPILPTSR